MNAIEVHNLVKRYRKAPTNAVDDISFDVRQGALFCLLGPNGAGKTTTVSILTTTLAPSSGRVVVAGRDLASDQSAVRRDLGIVFQQSSLDLNLTAEENVRLHAVLYGLYPWRPRYRWMPPGYRRQVDELASVLDVGDVIHRRARTLSGGTRRKLEIVRALMHHPRVLFLDEPTAGLDPESRRRLWGYLEQVRAQYGTTIFLTTHYLEEAEGADEVCVLAHGRVIERGRPADIKGRHGRRQLVLDAPDRGRLRGELQAMGLEVAGPGPLRVSLGTGAGAGADIAADIAAGTAVGAAARGAQCVVRALESDLTSLEIMEPTLEDVYLLLLAQARPAGEATGRAGP